MMPPGLSAPSNPLLADDCTISEISALAGGPASSWTVPNLASGAFDCIFACPGLEWANDLPGSLSRLRHALKPDGVLLAAMLGGQSLHELRASWLHAETMLRGGASPRVAPVL